VVADGSAGPTNDHQAQFLGLAKRNVDRLHRLINDVLDFSRLERGGVATHIERYPLNELVAAALDRQRVAAEKRGIELRQDLGVGIGDVPLDQQRIGHLLSNLLSNAIRYCDGPLVRVSTLVNADEVIVTVRDNGPGIAPEYLETIFDPFVQLSSGLGRQVGGTGLGLAICRQIIELHSGRIWAESKPGEGSAFSFALPLGPKEENTSP
jgi:signal transduction histidine kinase